MGAKSSSVDTRLFYWKENNNLIVILACHMDYMIWGGDQYFRDNLINILKKTFNFMPEEKESFTYIGIQIKQNPESSIIINQDIYINLIQRIK